MAHAITIVATSGADVDLTADGDRIFDLAGTTRSGSPVIEGVSGSLIFEDAPYTVLFQSRSYPGPPGEVAGDLPEHPQLRSLKLGRGTGNIAGCS